MDIDTKDRYGKNILHKICQKGDATKFNELLGQISDFTTRTNNGSTYLHFAAQGGNKNICAVLVDKGLDAADTQTKDGRAPIHIAADCGFADIIELFLEKGVPPDTLTNFKETPLMIAAQSGHIDCVDLLVRKGANINHNLTNTTVLDRACWNGNYDMVKFLIDKGADVNARIGDMQYPLLTWIMQNASAIGGRTKIIKLLKESGAKSD
jgi:ankyrin repeat protein